MALDASNLAFQMPGCNERQAPTWDGKGATLQQFLRDFEELCEKYSVSKEDYFKNILRYLPSSEREVWESVKASLGSPKDNWSDFLEEIYELYPGSSDKRRWTENDLEMLTERLSSRSMTSQEQFANYFRQFLAITSFLLSKDRISKREVSRQLLAGLPYNLRVLVRKQLRIQTPLHDEDDPWPTGDIRNTVKILRTVECVVTDKLRMKGLLDEGSQMIGMRKEIWQMLSIPVRSDHTIEIESANQSKNTSVGLLPNLKLSFGHLDFYVQVQVVENASYDLLLGLPFLVLAESVTHRYRNGDATIRLSCPNTNAVITLPTHPRTRKEKIERLDF
ncbi:hypothetical protein BKA70DRAFT_1114129 [Coprinopsis sp. MPI-PUGE-AT-0042]|nr:hypothetical protein BKA70DRAFT_1114129 [Coprinopsis sp. MPI-PUGE-AT-0042]